MNSRSSLVGVLDGLLLTVAALLILALLIALVSAPPASNRRTADSAHSSLATGFDPAQSAESG
jgi:hypothetical protein